MSNNRSQVHEPGASQRKLHVSLPLMGLLLLAVALIGGVGALYLGASSAGKPVLAATPTAQSDASNGPLSTATTVAGAATDSTPAFSEGSVASPTPNPQLPLAGRRIGLDPGHGPREDLGAVYIDPETGRMALSEAEFNLDVALRCRDLLVARGAEVALTRETADTLTAPWPADANEDGIVGASGDDLQSRIDILNDFGAEVFLSIHANSAREPGNGDDLQVLYCGAPDCAFPAESKRLGGLVLAQLEARLGEAGVQVDGGSVINDLTIDASNPPLHMFMLGPANPPRHPRGIAMPGVLGETLYVTLPSGAEQLMRDDVRQAIALAYTNALQEFLLSRGD